MHRNTTLWCMVMLLSNIFNHRQLPYLQVFASVVFLFAFFPLSVAQDACPGDRTPPVMNCPATPIQVNTDPGICGAYVNFNVTAVDDCDVPTRLRNFTLLGSNNNRAYFLSSSSFNWQAALQDAAANGGHLVSLTSLVENNIVAGNGLAWIGLTDQGQEGSMNWITGEAVSFINWDTGEPDDGGGTGEDFGAIQNDGTWTDLDGTTSLPYIMELEGAVISPATGSMVSGDLFPVGTTTVTYTATDESRNSSSCSFTVVVSDLEAPTFIDPLQDTVINCNTAIPSSIVTANDPCNANPIAAVLVSDTTIAGSCAQAFAIVRTWEATDSNGNTNTLTQTISVQDTTAPSLICMAPAVELDANGMGQITTADVDNGSSDNCSATLNFRLSQSTFDCSDVGMLAITLFAEDDCGNVDSCLVDVNVQDNINPVFTNCPTDVTFTLEPGACRLPYDFPLSGSDNCTDANDLLLTQLQGPTLGSDLEKETVTTFEFELNDGNGNTANCTWTVTVLEFPITNFSLSCNNHINLSLDTLCEALIGADLILEGDQYACFEDYIVALFFDENLQQPLPSSSRITAAEVGQLIYYSVTDPATNLSCWGTLQAEDKVPPRLQCDCPVGVQPNPSDCEFFCFEEANLSPPIATDNCGAVSLRFTDRTDDQGMCGTTTIRRTWIATDASGNTASCEQEFRILPASLNQVMAPPNYDGLDTLALNCEDRCPDGPLPSCGNTAVGWNVLLDGPYAGHPAPQSDFYPCNGTVRCFGTGEPEVAASCSNINVTFADTRIDICSVGSGDGCFKILRKWTVVDWCTGDVQLLEQTIKVEDSEGPQFAGLEDRTISTDVWRCQADWQPVEPVLTDNCSSTPLTYSLRASGGELSQRNGMYELKNLDPGTYQLIYTAQDCCGNQSEDSIQLTVIDDVPPVAVCDQNTITTISTTTDLDDDNLGSAKVFASSFDDGSFDNCSSEIWFKVIRMDEYDSNGNGKPGESVIAGDWEAIDCGGANGDDDIRAFPPSIVLGVDACTSTVGLTAHPNHRRSQSYFDDHVKFCCEDIENGPIMLVFRVFDQDPTCYEFRNVFPAGNPTFDAWYATNPHKAPSEYTGVIQEAMSANDWPVPGTGNPGPLYGHFSDCMVEVIVQDKLPPFVVAPPSVVVTCDFWFEFDPDNPNDYTDELDAVFGKVVEGSADLSDRDSIFTLDRVCPLHPRFSEFAPASPFDDPCYDDQYNLFWGIDGYVLDNCAIDLEQTVVPDLSCGTGTIVRRWRAADGQGNWSNIATQTITIINCREFYVPTVCWRFTPRDIGSCDFIGGAFAKKLIEWPCDIELNRCQGPTNEVFLPENLDVLFDEDRRPRFADDNCSLLATSYEDLVFTFVDSACLKIFRDWELIDWCRFESGLQPYSWQWTQVIKLLNEEGPTFENCSQTACGFGNPGSPNADQCVGEVWIDPGISDDCSMIEDLRIDYKFDFFDDGIYDAFGYSDTYGPIYPFPNPNNLPVRRFEPADYAIRGFYPVGTHRILWAVEDGCGNSNICEYLLTIEDCKPPTAYCLPGISTIPMPSSAGGFIDIWASDFDLGSYDNCSDTSALRFAFSADPNDRSIRRTCDGDDTGQLESLTIYVFDEADNYSTCEVSLLLTDCRGQSQASISGAVALEEGEKMEDVMVHLEGYMNAAESTQTNGFFAFANLPTSHQYVVRPEKNTDPLNGISTYDLVLISKHVLGIENLDTPYKMIAADVNKSGNLTAFDLVELRKMILFIHTEFPNNSSWRFVPTNYIFSNLMDPFADAFPEVYRVDDLAEDMTADFIAIKTGDVNGSAIPNQAIASEERLASGGVLTFTTEDRLLEAGETYVVTIAAKPLASQLLGYQFTMGVDEKLVDVLDIQALVAGLSSANFGTTLLDKGALTLSWHAGSKPIKLDERVFQLKLRAKRTTALSQVLNINSHYTKAEAYQAKNATDEPKYLSVELAFDTLLTTQPNGYELLPNNPNPFKNETTIGFVLPEAMTAKIVVYDLAGRISYEFSDNFEKGYNEWGLNRGEIGLGNMSAGVYYYSLIAKDFKATRRMIVIE